MCGIFCSISPIGVHDRSAIKRLRHRGPDASGEWTSHDSKAYIAHARLAILDLSEAGAQPMVSENGRYILAFNGEIYNHNSIREKIGRGDWKGTSDTETILRGYEKWGAGVVPLLRGMFAFVIYDTVEQRLFLARDFPGVKPLYYLWHSDGILVASEVRAFGNKYDPKITEAALASYLAVGSCPEDELLHSQINSFPAGNTAVYSLEEGLGITPYRYVALPATKAASYSVPCQVRGILERAVKENLLSDVPVACFLSGGVDSSIITALAAKFNPGRVATFSVGFKERAFDETQRANAVAKHYNTQHQRIELEENEVIEFVQEAVRSFDLPSVDAINTYVVSKAVARFGFKVALSGLGADELFGGYPSFADVPKLMRLKWVPKSLLNLLLASSGSIGRRLRTMPRDGTIAEIANWRRVFWNCDMLREVGLPLREFPIRDMPIGLDRYAQISWVEITRYMRHTLLRDTDQMSMAVSLELRVPYLDSELLSFVLTLPHEEKTKYPYVKGLLVEACKDLLLPQTYNRRKMGFELPMDSWIRGPLKKFASEGLELLGERRVLARQDIKKIDNEFSARKIHWTRLWSLVVLGHYLRSANMEIADPTIIAYKDLCYK